MSLKATLSEEFCSGRMRKKKMVVGSPWGMACLAAAMASKLQGSNSHTELDILGCTLIHGLDPRQFVRRLAACFSLLISQPSEA